MEPVRVGVVGCGVIGTNHMGIATSSPGLELAAAADLVESYRTRAQERFKPAAMYESGEELFDDPNVELVVLAFPTRYRFEMGMKALAKGKHLLTEKPVAMHADEVRSLIAARGELKAACCSSRYRFTDGARKATEIVRSGALGDLRILRHRNINPAGKKPGSPRPEWRLKKHLNGGGYLVNWGCYDLDYLLGLTEWTLKPTSVFAQIWTIPSIFVGHAAPNSDAETHYMALIQCEGGAVLSLERSEYTAASREEAWAVIGSEGSLRLHMLASRPNRIVMDKGDSETGVSSETVWEQNESSGRHHRGPLTDIAAAIREDREPMTSLERALVMQQITDAIYESAETGRSVSID